MRRGLAQLLPEGVLRLIRDPPNVRLYVGIMRIPSSQAQPNFYVGARLIRGAFSSRRARSERQADRSSSPQDLRGSCQYVLSDADHEI